jgi:signal transduction histidine kinase
MDTDEFSLVREAIKPTQIEEIISRVYEDLKPETDRKGLVFTIEKPKRPLPKILVDADFLEQAFYNLTDNAIKYTAKGFVKIVLNQESNQLVVKIQDSGVGIPLEDQKKIFDKFARAKNAIDMYTDGSGLGLFIVKKIIEAHQGAINFISKENEGTVFTVSLPVGSVGLKKVN